MFIGFFEVIDQNLQQISNKEIIYPHIILYGPMFTSQVKESSYIWILLEVF